ncbi:MAG: hypothetical protein SNJ82_06390 [Gemmataceae bacterium]
MRCNTHILIEKADLPIPTSLRESTVKPISQQVMGSKKFCTEPGSAAVL